MSEELKPCPVPWCRNEKPPYVAHSPGAKPYYVVICAGCGCNAPEKPTKAEAIAAWNTRERDAVIEQAQKVADTRREVAAYHDTYKKVSPNGLMAKHAMAVDKLTALLPPKEPKS